MTRFNKAIVSLIALAPLVILTGGCAHGQNASNDKIQINPSAEYLRSLAREHNTKTCGPATEAALMDWVAQNEPDK